MSMKGATVIGIPVGKSPISLRSLLLLYCFTSPINREHAAPLNVTSVFDKISSRLNPAFENLEIIKIHIFLTLEPNLAFSRHAFVGKIQLHNFNKARFLAHFQLEIIDCVRFPPS